jgi:hypothetical protein
VSGGSSPPDVPDVDAYCRAIESHLCRKNDGHLIRVTGPAFIMVRGWAEQGIPLGVAQSGIDRTFERYYAKGARRRPVHIAFCEADVLDAFDAWRRALGLGVVSSDETDAAPATGRHPSAVSLPAHVDRVLARLTALRVAATADRKWDAALESAVRRLDALRVEARQARGHARAIVLEQLAGLDEELLAHAKTRLNPSEADECQRQAESELDGFRERMSRDAYLAALDAARARQVRLAAGLPQVWYEA